MRPDPAGSLAIGGVRFVLEDPGTVPTRAPEPIYREFLAADASFEVPLRIRHDPLPPLGWRRLRYRPNYLWAVRETAAGFLLGVREGSPRQPPGRLLSLDRRWTRGDLLVRQGEDGSAPHPLGFPLDVVLVSGVLAHHGGVVVHAAAAVVDGRGLVFAGRSGAGKTTIARVLRAAGVEVVGDERVVLRAAGDAILLHGTPWPGDLGVVSPRSAPVAGLFFLEHGPTTRTATLTPAAAGRALLPRCRLPFWDRAAMSGVLDTVAEIVRRVPCQRLRFRPDGSVVEVLARVVR